MPGIRGVGEQAWHACSDDTAAARGSNAPARCRPGRLLLNEPKAGARILGATSRKNAALGERRTRAITSARGVSRRAWAAACLPARLPTVWAELDECGRGSVGTDHALPIPGMSARLSGEAGRC